MSDLDYETVKTKEDLIRFTAMLSEDYFKDPDSWENDNIGDFLESMSAWLADAEAIYSNNEMEFPKNPDWQLMAGMLIGGKYYE
jgi:hypothetical protein